MEETYTPRQPQDDLDADNKATDPVIQEENEDITETLHVDPAEFKERLDDNENPDLEQSEDTREALEDYDQET
ncbi:hypothetical protein CL689_07360 [Candidatus Saccharibacteria bacterium]|nr:hypothetical protein [Candidatus Saccharibacteria bacterium]MBJ58233.1 hypothetical protein [Candidatus Saccharibacteria bacterium]MBQ69835.1 hypothetical protein [Candidatus Saccharibacteria bacterium]|tara:strand:- start:388 stop:606 length:219 start_codon:yes stop_codon:yes gene_type:complete